MNSTMRRAVGTGLGMGAAGIAGNELATAGLGSAAMAGVAPGLAADWMIKEKLKTNQMQEEGKQSQALAKALERAYPELVKNAYKGAMR